MDGERETRRRTASSPIGRRARLVAPAVIALGLLSATLPAAGSTTAVPDAAPPSPPTSSSSSDAAATDGAGITGGVLVIDDLDSTAPTTTSRRLVQGLRTTDPEPARSYETTGAEFRVCFRPGTPPAVEQLAAEAADQWAWALDLDGPTVEIEMHWLAFGSPRTLAAAGPGRFVVDDRLPLPDTRYPVALANELLDIDHTPRQNCDASQDPDVLVLVNSTAGGDVPIWHTDPGPAPIDRLDLGSVLLHEIGHGLGFIGSAETDADAVLRWPANARLPFVFDHFAVRCHTESVDTCQDPRPVSIGDTEALTSDELWLQTDTDAWQLFAPETWNRGSSFAHLDEDRYQADNALMTPYLQLGESHRGIDEATISVIQQLGYQRSAPLPPFDSEASFVLTVRDMIGRDGDEARYVEQARANGAIATLVTLFERVEYQRRERIARLYHGLLERSPDTAGLDFWATVFNDQSRYATIAASFVASQEFTEGRSLTNDDLVERLYARVLDRAPDPQGAAFWSWYLSIGAAPAIIVETLVDSPEHRARADRETFIDIAALALVDRLPDVEERNRLRSSYDAGQREGVVNDLLELRSERATEE